MSSLMAKCFVSESVCTEQGSTEFRTPFCVILATPLEEYQIDIARAVRWLVVQFKVTIASYQYLFDMQCFTNV